jgi:hypothetical protein
MTDEQMIVHRGQFMRATQIALDCVAAVYDRLHGGQIVDYVALGQHTDVRSARLAAERAGLFKRGTLRADFGPAVTIGGVTYSRPVHISTYRKADR